MKNNLDFLITLGRHFAPAMVLLCLSCTPSKENSQVEVLTPTSGGIKGNPKRIEDPYLVEGNGYFIAASQNGSFPPPEARDIVGKMGGVWKKPLKLLQGFEVQVMIEEDTFCLNKAHNFTHFEKGSRFDYKVKDLDISRFETIADKANGAIVEFILKNQGKPKRLAFNFTGVINLSSGLKEVVNGTDKARYNQRYEAIVAKDDRNDWYVMFGADRRPSFHGIETILCYSQPPRLGTSGSLMFSMEIEKDQSEVLRIFIAGSDESVNKLQEEFSSLKMNYD